MPLRTVAATRYVTPLREGGSVPAVVEGDDEGTYVLKFRAAAQGKKALVAEIIAGEIGRALGLPVPELVLLALDPVLGRSEPDPELAAPIKASGGLNLGMDFLPGAIAFDAAAPIDRELATKIVWFDAYVANVDRTARNTNLLVWGKRVHLIDHGAALYPHHDWSTFTARSQTPFPLIRQHVLLRHAADLATVDQALAGMLDAARLAAIVDLVPEEWLDSDGPPADARRAYVEFLVGRLAVPRAFAQEVGRAVAEHV